MNDRFKFRAWDKTKNTYIEDAQFTYDDGCEGGVGSFRHYSFRNLLEDENCIVEQCTGLKDKNGKLIYEGDIIELTRARNYGYIPKGSRLVIKWNTFDCCGFSTGIRGNLTKKCADNCIIVGSIHENKDLLENENAMV